MESAFGETGGLFGRLGLGLAVGLLVGLERGWSARGEGAGRRVAGLRTFGLLGLLGGVIGLLGLEIHPLLAAIVLAAAAAALVAGYLRDMRVDGNVSATSTIAGLLTLCLGILATNGFAKTAVLVATVATLVLSLRTQLHGWLARLSETDVQATARFAIIAAAVLPLLPDRRFGPYDAWNPRELWLVVVLVTAFSFAGYIASRSFGARRGILATAAIGGMYSSTAVIAVLARRLKLGDAPAPLLAAGIAVASTAMFIRVLLLTAALATSALPSLAFVAAPAGVVALAACLWLLRRDDGGQPGGATVFVPRNPFELLPALGFALLVGALALATRWAEARFGDVGIAALLAITGSFDVDAAIVTLGGLPAGTIAPWLAGIVLAVPILFNTLFKAAIVVSLVGWRSGIRAAAPLLASGATMLVFLALAALRL
jgi:uncharacterized membrane protein (DUF4010 family)